MKINHVDKVIEVEQNAIILIIVLPKNRKINPIKKASIAIGNSY